MKLIFLIYLLAVIVSSCSTKVKGGSSFSFEVSSFINYVDSIGENEIEIIQEEIDSSDLYEDIQADSVLKFYHGDFLYEFYALKDIDYGSAMYLGVKSNRVPPGEISVLLIDSNGLLLDKVSKTWFVDNKVEFIPLFKGDNPALVIYYDYRPAGYNRVFSSIFEFNGEQFVNEKEITLFHSSIPLDIESGEFGRYSNNEWKPVKKDGIKMLECHEVKRQSLKQDEWGDENGKLIVDTIYYIEL